MVIDIYNYIISSYFVTSSTTSTCTYNIAQIDQWYIYMALLDLQEKDGAIAQ